MTSSSPQLQTKDAFPSFDIKAGHYTLPSLLINEDDSDALDAFLASQVARLPHFFDQAPIVIDLSRYPADRPLKSFAMIVGMIRGYGMIPVGVRGASKTLGEQARLLELAIMPKLHQCHKKNTSNASPATVQQPEMRPRAPLIIDSPIRSGQRVYAKETDLILLAGVSSGAEVMADGNIHAYGAVRGRLLAGVQGNTQARIFCRNLGAELVAIAGRYQVSEDLPAQLLGHSVQISLQGDALKFASL